MTRKKANKCDWKARALRAEKEAFDIVYSMAVVLPFITDDLAHAVARRAVDRYMAYLKLEVKRGR